MLSILYLVFSYGCVVVVIFTIMIDFIINIKKKYSKKSKK